MAAIARRGMAVAPFKIGPDFIDPGHHGRVTGWISRNLDGWMLSKNYNLQTFGRSARAADIAVVEGVMGLFDGYDGKSEAGSTAQMAKWLGLPVVLVVDAGSMARSAAAVVLGFEQFDPELSFAGVIFNHLGSRRHLAYLKEAVRDRIGAPCLGGISQKDAIAIPERHLGLVTREDHPLTDDRINALADLVEDGIDLDKLLQALPEVSVGGTSARCSAARSGRDVRIGVARDNAFCFYYQDNLDLLERQGAQLEFFSPMIDRRLPEDLDGIYFGGGYPELFAEKLAGNASLRGLVKKMSEDGMPIYGECGGFMYLCQDLWDLHARRYPMAGCFAFTAKMQPKLNALGYREITLTQDTVIGSRGLTLRGHEFHYSELTPPNAGGETVYRVTGRAGMDRASGGYTIRQTLGSYIHLHFGSQPRAAGRFVENCRNYRLKKGTRDET